MSSGQSGNTSSVTIQRCPCCWANPACNSFAMRVPKVIYWNIFGDPEYTCFPATTGTGCLCGNDDHTNNFSSGVSLQMNHRFIETPEVIDFGYYRSGSSCVNEPDTGPLYIEDYTGDIWEHVSGPYTVNGFDSYFTPGKTPIDCTYNILAYITAGNGTTVAPGCLGGEAFDLMCQLIMFLDMSSGFPVGDEITSQPCAAATVGAGGEGSLFVYRQPLTNALFPNSDPFSSTTLELIYNFLDTGTGSLCSECSTLFRTCAIDSVITE